MSKVMFGRSSARRIADAVRKVERMPGGEQDLQRRRAGGLGRSTLWEVTAVQTGPETVTIKRVANIDFDLNDPSEKTDILYDPDNAPSVGDRGLLIRLGNGSLFFFKPAVKIRSYANEAAVVKDTAPDTTFDYNADGHTIYFSPTLDQRLVYKFPKPILMAGSYQTTDVCLGIQNTTTPGALGNGVLIHNLTANPITRNARLQVGFIGEDFDCSAITWNILSGLSGGGHSHFLAALNIGLSANGYAAFGSESDTPPDYLMIGVSAISATVYGMVARGLSFTGDIEITSSVLGYITNPIAKAVTGRSVWADFGFRN